jgi:hypothetical protein
MINSLFITLPTHKHVHGELTAETSLLGIAINNKLSADVMYNRRDIIAAIN